jgi:hypothetical protein
MKIYRCGLKATDDDFGKALLANDSMTAEKLQKFYKDPQVVLESGEKGSLFDAVEDTNAEDCLKKIHEIAAKNE